MRSNDERQTSKNAEDEHVHTPKSGGEPDDALKPGNTSGSGDVERVQREHAIDEGGSNREAAIEQQPLPEGRRTKDDEAQRILSRNRQLLAGAEPGPEGEEQATGNHTESSSDGRRTGDYSND
jgi:hypothetical protein